MRKILLALLFILSSTFASAQQSLTNESVITLVKAGIAEELIITAINASAGSYDTSASGLISLKSVGVSDKIMSAIVLKAGGTSIAPVSAVATPSLPTSTSATADNVEDPALPHEAGIYIFDEKAPAGAKMLMLEPNVYTSGKTGGIFASAMTYGIAKIKVKAVLRGAHANAHTSSSQPVFYFYFEQQGAGLSHASSIFSGTSTPNEYTLLKFAVKDSTRETTIAKANAFGASGGTDDAAVVLFTYTKLRPGVYKVVPNTALQPGEYGFISSGGPVAIGPMGSASNSRVFDFSRN